VTANATLTDSDNNTNHLSRRRTATTGLTPKQHWRSYYQATKVTVSGSQAAGEGMDGKIARKLLANNIL